MKKFKFQIANNKHAILLFIIATLAIWLPRAFKLDSFVYVDETSWLQRSANFYYALEQREFDRTYQNSSPGVITMWVETAAFFTEFRGYRILAPGYIGDLARWEGKFAITYEHKYNHLEEFIIESGIDPHDILVTSRQYTVLLISVVLGITFLFIKKIFGIRPAIVGLLLLSFDSFYLANTRFAHLDGPMSVFLLLSLFSFMNYLYVNKDGKYLFISAVAGGLAWLSKQPGLLIIPTISLLVMVKALESSKVGGVKQYLRKTLGIKAYVKPLAIWGGVFMVVIFLVWPAMWVASDQVIKRALFFSTRFIEDSSSGEIITTNAEKIVSGAEQIVDEGEKIVNGADQIVAGDERIASKDVELTRDWLRYPSGFMWLTTPVILIGLLGTVIAYFKRFDLLENDLVRKGVVALFLFALLFTAFISFPLKSSARYYITVHAVLDLIAGIGWVAIAAWTAKKISAVNTSNIVYWGVIAFALGYQITTSLSLFPYYLPYNNPLLGGNAVANETRFMSFGEGLDQAAEYINQKPGSKKMKVLSWYAFGPFSNFFVGESFDSQLLVSHPEALLYADYLVSYRNAWYRDYLEPYNNALSAFEPEHVIWINGIEYVRIYDVSTLPPDLFEFNP